MAYQARHRDPLFDSDTQAIIERRGKELLVVGQAVNNSPCHGGDWLQRLSDWKTLVSE